MSGESAAQLRFLGATDTVTGSRYLVEAAGRRIAIDCGLFQGYKVLRERNRHPYPVPPSTIDAVVVTHAHLDHTGYLPALVRDGFTGSIHTTAGTEELCRLLLPDCGRLLEEEAGYASERRSSKHEKPTPVYTEADAEVALRSFRPHEFDDVVPLGEGLSVRFIPAGHILGAAQLQLEVADHRIHFTGDLGRADDPLMKPPRPLEATDVLVTESTYGNRSHPHLDPAAELGAVVSRVVKRGGVVVIPAFAVGRAETLLLHLSRLRDRGDIPAVPVYLNSPMAVDASQIYQRHPDEHRVSDAEFRSMYSLAHLVHSVDESKLLNLRGGPMVIISASGMLTGGRVLHHVAAYGSDPRNAIVLSGFQAGGTRGAALVEGERTLRIYGRDIPIRAEVVALESLSAHADSDQLIAWMKAAPVAPSQTYITHGEPEASDALRIRIQRELGWAARVPELGETDAVEPTEDTIRSGGGRSSV
jgi:metallo-beta-lactamase family protein